MRGDGQRKDCYRITVPLTIISHVSPWVPDLCKEILDPFPIVSYTYESTHKHIHPDYTHTQVSI